MVVREPDATGPQQMADWLAAVADALQTVEPLPSR